jgi:transposase
MGRGLVVFL